METKSFYYMEYYNYLIDEEGTPFIDVFKIMSPAKYAWCKLHRGTYYFDCHLDKGIQYEVVFPREGEEEDYYYFLDPDLYVYEREQMYLNE